MAYEKFFGLKDAPFRLTPDPEYYFPSDVHKEALQTLIYSIRAGEGFVQITGDPGTGKTLILRTILRQLGNEVTTALILNPRLSPQELLKAILEDLGLDPLQMEKKSKEELLRSFRDFLLDKAKQGLKTVVIIDEAQNLPNDTMEELRLLSNLETEKEKLLQIILVGQLELEKKLQSPELKQLNQRITIRYRLKPLSKNDTIAYIYHRIRIAGGGEHIRFTPTVLDRIHKLSKGVPRLINIICERALMAAYVEGKNTIEKSQIKKAMESIVGEEEISPVWFLKKPASIIILSLLLFIIILGAAYWFFPFFEEKTNNFIRKKTILSEEKAAPDQRNAALSKKEDFNKMEIGLQKREEVLNKKENILAKKETALKERETKLEQKEERPFPPPEAFYVPKNRFFIAVDCDANKAFIFQGSDSGLSLKKKLEYKWPYGEGLFILGKDDTRGEFIFHHMSFLLGKPYVMPSDLWRKISPFISGNAVPLLAYSSSTKVNDTLIKKAREIKSILSTWSDTWKSMDIERLINFYGDIFTIYYINLEKPLVFSKAQFYKHKKDVFLKSSFITLKISDPLCLVDPVNPKIAVAVFYQKYQSQIYTDEGTKVLYFSLIDNLEGGEVWKIVAKLWLPL